MKDPSGSPFASSEARIRRRIRQRKQPVQDRAKATTEALVEATLQVLVRDGYAKLTTTRVAERAGVSVGTLYQYFPDKRSLVMALKVRYFGLMLDAVDGALERSDPDDFPTRLRSAMEALLAVKRENLALTKALREPMAGPDGRAFFRDTAQRFADVLAPSVARALGSAPRIPERTALLVAALEGAISHAVYEAPEWLAEPWFLDDLVALGTGYLGPRSR